MFVSDNQAFKKTKANMITDLTTSVTDISPEQLDALFASTPDSTVSADDLTLGKDADGVAFVPAATNGNMDIIDLDALDDVKTEEETEEDEKKEGEEGDDKTKTEKPAEEKEEKPEAGDTTSMNGVLKSTVDFLVEKGHFKDFEGREDLEITEEVYAEILEAQISAAVEERYEAKKSSAGDYGQAILDFIEDGGDPDTIIDLFKERKEVNQLDISSEDNQRQLVARYYKEVHNWKPERIKKQLDFVSSEEGGLETEATEIKEKYEDHFKQEAADLAEHQATQKAQYEAQQVARQKAFETSIKGAIQDYDVDPETKKKLESALFKYKKLEDGTKVNDFYLKFAEWQSDPKKYVQLVEFITANETYEKRREQKTKTEVAARTFNFVKGNQAVSKHKGSEHTSVEERSKNKGTDFSIIFKK